MELDLDKIRTGEPLIIKLQGRTMEVVGVNVNMSQVVQPTSISYHGMNFVKPSIYQRLQLDLSGDILNVAFDENYMPPDDYSIGLLEPKPKTNYKSGIKLTKDHFTNPPITESDCDTYFSSKSSLEEELSEYEKQANDEVNAILNN